MSEVFRTVTFKYDGREHTMTPSIALLRRLKMQGINNMLLAQQCMKGGADPLDLVIVHKAFLQEAGVFITDEQSYLWVSSGNEAEMLSFFSAYIQSVLPGIDLGKKLDAPGGNPKKAKRKSPTT